MVLPRSCGHTQWIARVSDTLAPEVPTSFAWGQQHFWVRWILFGLIVAQHDQKSNQILVSPFGYMTHHEMDHCKASITTVVFRWLDRPSLRNLFPSARAVPSNCLCENQGEDIHNQRQKYQRPEEWLPRLRVQITMARDGSGPTFATQIKPNGKQHSNIN